MTPLLETPRLVLPPLELADADQVQQIFPVWEVVRYLASVVPWPYPPDGALTFYRDMALPAIERGEAWHWTLRLKDAPSRIIGSIGLMKTPGNNRGFWIGLPWQRRGLMSEACAVVTDYWFNSLGFPVLRASKASANVASSRLSNRQGMRLVAREPRDFVCGRMEAEIWEIAAEEWNARAARR